MTNTGQFKISRMGEDCALVSFGNEIDPLLNARSLLLAEHLAQNPFEGFREAVPAYSSVAVFYDPFHPAFTDCGDPFDPVKDTVGGLLEGLPEGGATRKRTVEIPVTFGGDSGPDLKFVASRNGISVDEAVSIFTAGEYRVYFLGFLPGFAYLGELDRSIHTPRKETPRTLVPKGSVGIAGSQTGIYPLDSPGGWQIIGRTKQEMFDAESEDPAFLKPGDVVRFREKKG